MTTKKLFLPFNQVKLLMFLHFHSFNNNGFRYQGITAKVLSSITPNNIDRNSYDNVVFRKQIENKNVGPRFSDNQIEGENVFRSSFFFITTMNEIMYLNEGFSIELNIDKEKLKQSNIEVEFELVRYNIRMDHNTQTYYPDLTKIVKKFVIPNLKEFEPYYLPLIFTDKYNFGTFKCSLSYITILPYDLCQFNVNSKKFLNYYKSIKVQYNTIYTLLSSVINNDLKLAKATEFNELSSEFPALTVQGTFLDMLSLLPKLYKIWFVYTTYLSKYSHTFYNEFHHKLENNTQSFLDFFTVHELPLNIDNLNVADDIRNSHISLAKDKRSSVPPKLKYEIPDYICNPSSEPILFISELLKEGIKNNKISNANEIKDLLNKCIKCKIKYYNNQKTCNECHSSITINNQLNIIVLLHGLQGNNWGMKMVRDYLSMILPHYEFVNCTSFEKTSEELIDVSSKNAANEIMSHLNTISGKDLSRIKSISFVAHSLGGLILQSTLTQLPKDLRYKTLISLNVPYLGTLYGSSLTSTGISILKIWNKKVGSLNEMDLSDSKDIQKSYLYKLSETSSLSKFENLVFLSSPDDRFVPYGSTRIQICKGSMEDNRRGIYYQQMINNYLKKVDASKIHFIDVSYNFDFSLDSMIGRKAHNQCLEDPLFMIRFMKEVEKYF